jgi:hypothetical protein
VGSEVTREYFAKYKWTYLLYVRDDHKWRWLRKEALWKQKWKRHMAVVLNTYFSYSFFAILHSSFALVFIYDSGQILPSLQAQVQFLSKLIHNRDTTLDKYTTYR